MTRTLLAAVDRYASGRIHHDEVTASKLRQLRCIIARNTRFEAASVTDHTMLRVLSASIDAYPARPDDVAAIFLDEAKMRIKKVLPGATILDSRPDCSGQ